MQNSTITQQTSSGTDQIHAIHNIIECSYYLSLVVSICEGEVEEISRIWVNDQLLNLEQYKIRLYLGSEDQLPDLLLHMVVLLIRHLLSGI